MTKPTTKPGTTVNQYARQVAAIILNLYGDGSDPRVRREAIREAWYERHPRQRPDPNRRGEGDRNRGPVHLNNALLDLQRTGAINRTKNTVWVREPDLLSELVIEPGTRTDRRRKGQA